ncbi:MAG: phage regulatory CII family protein [Rhodospirillaceae bacterium]
MSDRPSSETERNALKSAFRLLLKRAGGQESAAFVTRGAHQSLNRYGNPSIPEIHAPIDVVVDLERDVGEPIVTRRLADLAGFVLFAKPPANADPDWVARLGRLAKEVGEAMARIGEAVASGGTVTAEESRRLELRREIAEGLSALAAIDHVLREVEAKES